METMMKAVCVTPNRSLEFRDIPVPTDPPPDHVLIDMEACAINHGDKAFLTTRSPPGVSPNLHDIWGASGVGRIVAIGQDVPAIYAGKQVAIYRSMSSIRSTTTTGLWCEKAQVHYLSCLILPDHVNAKDFSGSLVNIMTAYAFLQQIVEDGHRGAIATAGNSATGRALLELAHRQGVPVISIFRSDGAKADLERLDAGHSLDMREVGFEQKLEALATLLQTTAVFDGVGGPLLTQIMPVLPWRSTIYCYGFMAGGGPIAIASPLLVAKNLTIRGFSNFATPTVKDSARLAEALTAITAIADHPAFKTKLGQQFRFDQIDEAMAAEGEGPSILIP